MGPAASGIQAPSSGPRRKGLLTVNMAQPYIGFRRDSNPTVAYAAVACPAVWAAHLPEVAVAVVENVVVVIHLAELLWRQDLHPGTPLNYQQRPTRPQPWPRNGRSLNRVSASRIMRAISTGTHRPEAEQVCASDLQLHAHHADLRRSIEQRQRLHKELWGTDLQKC